MSLKYWNIVRQGILTFPLSQTSQFMALRAVKFYPACFRCHVAASATPRACCEPRTTTAVFVIPASGKTYMMLGVDDSPVNLGVIPSAIAWLYRLVDERRQTTGARFSVRVAAVEVTGRHETVKDLLANVTASKSSLGIGSSRHQTSASDQTIDYNSSLNRYETEALVSSAICNIRRLSRWEEGHRACRKPASKNRKRFRICISWLLIKCTHRLT